jgi:SAM-dependent methyltransferase
MEVARQIEIDQKTLWNGRAGNAWVDMQDLLDQVLRPFEDILVRAVSDEAAKRVLDVGCGTGSTTLALGRVLQPGGSCVGIDISEPMIAAARSRTGQEGLPVSFICADAQSYDFEPDSFDMIVSRFGVMFFDQPVQAFANLRRAAQPGARLLFIAWRGAAENPFMTTAERAAAPLLPDNPPRRSDGPGQFAFADSGFVQRIFSESGWDDIDMRPIDVSCALPETELVHYITRLGPLGVVLQDVDEKTRARVIGTVRAAFDPFVHGAEVRFNAACWSIRGRAPAQ